MPLFRLSYTRNVVVKEVEVAKSVDDLLTPQSIEFLDFVKLDAKIASALKRRIFTNQYFRRRINVEEQHVQKYSRFL